MRTIWLKFKLWRNERKMAKMRRIHDEAMAAWAHFHEEVLKTGDFDLMLTLDRTEKEMAEIHPQLKELVYGKVTPDNEGKGVEP